MVVVTLWWPWPPGGLDHPRGGHDCPHDGPGCPHGHLDHTRGGLDPMVAMTPWWP